MSAGPSGAARRARHPLFLKFLKAFLLVILVSFIPLAWFLNGRMRALLESEIVERQRGELLLFDRALAARWPADAAPARVDAIVDSLSRGLFGRLTVIAPDGRVLGDSQRSGPALLAMENHASRPEVAAALVDGEGIARRYSTSVGESFLYRARTLRDASGRPLAVVRLAFSRAGLEAELGRAGVLLLLGMALALGVAVLASLALARKLTRPIETLRRSADAMARGDLGRDVNLRSGDELEDLGRALNRMSHDLSDQRAELVAEKEQLVGVLESMVEGVLVVDRGGRVVQANAALQQMFGLARPPVGRTSLEALRHPALEEILGRAVAARERTTGVVRLSHPLERRLEVGVAPLGADGVVHGAVAVFHDITRLEKLESVRRDFAANVSHEIRTPVTAIRGYAETLRETADTPEERARFAQIIIRHADRLTELVDDLLALSSLESADYRLRVEELSAAELLQAVEEGFRPRAEERRVTLTREECAADLELRGDRRLLEQVLGNLVDNAIKYTEAGGHVTMRAAGADGTISFTIADTGSGIPPADLDRVFERFFRVDRARSRKLGGTGLGLAIVKHIVMLHRGEVRVRSRLGEGSEFTVTLPRTGPTATGVPPSLG